MKTVLTLVLTVAADSTAFRADDGRLLCGDVYGRGTRGVVILAHGGYLSRASWTPTADALQAEGFLVLVFESRGATVIREIVRFLEQGRP